MKRVLIVILLLLFVQLASGLQILGMVADNPDSYGYYTKNFTVAADIDIGPVNVYFNTSPNYGSNPINATKETNTRYTMIFPVVNLEGEYTVTAVAQNLSGNNSVPVTKTLTSLKIDTKAPNIDAGKVGNTTAGLQDSIAIKANISNDEPNLDHVRVMKVGGSNYFNMTSAGSGFDWYYTTTPEDLGCTAGGLCDIQIEAYDKAYNKDVFTDAGDLRINVPSNVVKNLSITIQNPGDGSVMGDSIIMFLLEIEANGVGVPTSSARFCNYQIYDEETAGSFVKGGTFFKGNFTKDGTKYSLASISDEIQDGSYKLEMTCYDSDDNPYTAQSSFVVLDTTPPKVDIELIGVSNSSANISLNSSEFFMIKTLEFKILGEEGSTKLSTQEVFANYYEFSITGLSPGIDYVVQARGTDRAGEAAERDDNEFVATEQFKAWGGGVEGAKLQEKTIADITTKGVIKNTSKGKLVGEEYSHGIDWLREGEEQKVTITNFEMNVREIMLKSNEDIRNIKLEVRTSLNPPDWINNTPDNTSTFQFMEIIATNAPDEQLKYAKIRFEVNEIWLRNNGLDVKDVVLFRMVDNEWVQLPTSLIKEGALLHTYESLSPGFSLFLIGGKKGDKKSVEEAEEELEIDLTHLEHEGDTEAARERLGDVEEIEGRPWHFWAAGGLIFLVVFLIIYFLVISVRSGKKPKEELIDHRTIKKHMKRLESFVDTALKKGFSKEKLKENLVSSGWDAKLVEFVLRRK